MTPRPQAAHGGNGRPRSPEARPRGLRPDGPAVRDTGREEAPWARLARLHGELAEVYAGLALGHGTAASNGPNALDDGQTGALMSDVPATTTEPVSAAPFEVPDPRDFERLLGVRDVADRLGIDPKTVRRWRREGRLPEAIEIGGVIRWRREAIELWIREREGSR